MEERAKTFTERGKKQPEWVFVSILRFAQTQKERVPNGWRYTNAAEVLHNSSRLLSN
jgi:hypothetical protein